MTDLLTKKAFGPDHVFEHVTSYVDVDGAERVVQEVDVGVLIHGSGQTHPQFLPAAQADALLDTSTRASCVTTTITTTSMTTHIKMHIKIKMTTISRVERDGIVVRTLNFNRENEGLYPLAVLFGNFDHPRCLSSLSCTNEYLVIHSGGS